MKILMVEDEELAVRKLRGLLQEVKPDTDVLPDLDSIESTVEWILLKPIEKEDLVDAFDKFSRVKEFYSTAAPVFLSTAFW